MKEAYTAVIKNEGTWWIGWIAEVPGVNRQEAMKDFISFHVTELTRI